MIDRFTASDASLLHGETPEWHLHVTTLLPLDAATMPSNYDFVTFREALADKLRGIPRFRQRVAAVPFGLDRPVWFDAGPFDAEAHIRRIRLPAPVGRRELFDLTGEFAAIELPHDRPLWKCCVVENPKRCLEAVIIKNHHVLFDGVGGLESLQAMFDLAAEKSPPAPDAVVLTESRTDPAPGPLELIARSALRAIAVQPWETMKVARELVRQALPFGRALLDDDRPLLGLDAPRSPFAGRITAERSVAGAELSMPVIKAIRRQADVKVNGVHLAVIGGALRIYLADNGPRMDHAMVANIAVSTRGAEDGDLAGNKFSVMYATLGTDIADPVERLAAIRRSTLQAKRLSNNIYGSRDTTISAVSPPLLVNALGRMYRTAALEDRVQLIGNVGVSNVAGPPMQLFICGAAVKSMFVFGPLMLNSNIHFTAVSNADELDVGVVPDLPAMGDLLGPALDELADEIGLTR